MWRSLTWARGCNSLVKQSENTRCGDSLNVDSKGNLKDMITVPTIKVTGLELLIDQVGQNQIEAQVTSQAEEERSQVMKRAVETIWEPIGEHHMALQWTNWFISDSVGCSSWGYLLYSELLRDETSWFSTNYVEDVIEALTTWGQGSTSFKPYRQYYWSYLPIP